MSSKSNGPAKKPAAVAVDVEARQAIKELVSAIDQSRMHFPSHVGDEIDRAKASVAKFGE